MKPSDTIAVKQLAKRQILVDQGLTFMPSQRETARKGLKALSVRIERKAGISAAPAQVAPRLISDN